MEDDAETEYVSNKKYSWNIQDLLSLRVDADSNDTLGSLTPERIAEMPDLRLWSNKPEIGVRLMNDQESLRAGRDRTAASCLRERCWGPDSAPQGLLDLL